MRYLVLIILNLPLVLVAIVSLITEFKLGRISKTRLKRQILFWLAVTLFISGAFPIFNFLNHRPIFESHDFSVFDILQTTAIVYLLYFFNRQRQHTESLEQTLKDLHSELSIKLSISSNKSPSNPKNSTKKPNSSK